MRPPMWWNKPKLGPPSPNARQRVLAEWRGIDLSAAEKEQASAARSPEPVLARVLAELKLDRRREDMEILNAWPKLIDPRITAHAQPVNLAKGTLFINVDSHAWLSDIVRVYRHDILERLQNCFGKDRIKKVSFRIG